MASGSATTMPTTVSSPTQADAFDAAGVAAHRAARRTRWKRIAMPLAVASTDFVALLGHHHVDQLVLLAELDGDDPVAERAAVGGQVGLLHQAASAWPSSGKWSGLVEIADGAAVGHPLAFCEVQQVDDRPAAAVACRVGAGCRPCANRPCPCW